MMLLVDVANIYSAAKFKLGHLETKEGRPTGGLYGFIKSVNAAQRRFSVAHRDIVLAFECGGRERRREVMPEYKGDREPGDIFVEDDFEEIVTWARFSGHCVAMAEGCEADDLIAHFAKEHDSIILSKDHDFKKCLREGVVICRDVDKPTYSVADFHIEHGMDPSLYGVMCALAGDGSDNVKGIPGIGEKRAAKIMEEADYDFINVLGHPKVQGHADVVRRNLEVVSFYEPEGENTVVKMAERDADELAAFYDHWEFESLRKPLEVEM